MGYVQTDQAFTLQFDLPDLSFFNIPIPTPPPLPPVKVATFGDLPMEVSACSIITIIYDEKWNFLRELDYEVF